MFLARRVDWVRRRADRIALHVDLDQRGGGDLLEHHVIGVDEEMVFRPRYARRQVREDQIVPAVQRHQPVGGGQIDARLPLAGCVSGRIHLSQRRHHHSPRRVSFGNGISDRAAAGHPRREISGAAFRNGKCFGRQYPRNDKCFKCAQRKN